MAKKATQTTETKQTKITLKKGQVCIKFTRKPTSLETTNQYQVGQLLPCSEARANYWIRRGAAIHVDPEKLNESEDTNGEDNDNPGTPDDAGDDSR